MPGGWGAIPSPPVGRGSWKFGRESDGAVRRIGLRASLISRTPVAGGNYQSQTKQQGPHTNWCAALLQSGCQAQLEPTALSVLAMLLPADCTFWPWELACW